MAYFMLANSRYFLHRQITSFLHRPVLLRNIYNVLSKCTESGTREHSSGHRVHTGGHLLESAGRGGTRDGGVETVGGDGS